MTTPQGLVISSAHDAAQARLLDRGLAELTLAFTALLDPVDFDASGRVYIPTAAEIVRQTRAAAAAVAADFYTALRAVETAADATVLPFTPALPPEPPTAVLAASAEVTGPITAKASLARGLVMEEAMTRALTATLGAATRHVEGGPRDVARLNSEADPSSRGWVRRSGGVPCSFCAMLISRGPVYSGSTAGFRAHDHCHCKAVAFFGSDSGWTAQSAEMHSLWKDNPDAKEFRRAYEKRYRKSKDAESLPLAA